MANREKETLKKVQIIAPAYYARKDIQKAIFEFCKNRETIANFNNEFFAKRPDCLDYPSDIFNSVKKGATSFHCSEELWRNPLEISTDMTPEEYNEERIGWDFLIDIDSKYLDYSKIAAKLLIKALEHHGIKNIGIKFSGSKGFHILVPFKAFPRQIGEEETKNHFPDWARAIAGYIGDLIKQDLNKEILKLTNPEELEEKGIDVREKLCPLCGKPTIKKKIGVYSCPNFRCKTEVKSMKSNRKEMICPSCNGKLQRVSEEEVYFCDSCKTNSVRESSRISRIYGSEVTEARKKEVEFKEVINTEKAIDSVDIVLVASRHLFRAPYSLHEKTALASIPINKENIDSFKPSDADPLKIKEIKSFMPDCEEEEAKELLIQALDWSEKKPEEPKKYAGEPIDIKGLKITEEMFPPIIKKLLEGIKRDGRKRALSLMLSFFVSLEFPEDFIKEKIEEWNKKNYHPLKEGYIRSQISWHLKNKRLPPNYDKPIYKEFGITAPPEPGIKNPINYTIKMAMREKRRFFKKEEKNNQNSIKKDPI